MIDKTFGIVVGVVQYGDEILLLKRSSSKRFAPNKWEPVSGYLREFEAMEETVSREVAEETGLTGKIVTKGPAFEVDGDGAHWVIKPFLIRVESTGIRLSGEHSEAAWINPADWHKYDGVDDLDRDLKLLGLI